MPYNPGVTDQSGAILANGMVQSSGMMAQNFGNLLDKWSQKQDQDKTLLAQSKATENFIKAHPDLFGGQGSVDQMTAVDPKEAPVARYARLAQFTKDTVLGSELSSRKQQMEAQASEINLRNQQAAEFAQKVAAQKKAEADQAAQEDKLRQYGQFMNGVGSGVYSPQAQAQMSQDLYGAPSKFDVPATEPGEEPAGNQQLQDTVKMFQAIGSGALRPGMQETMIANNRRAAVAEAQGAARDSAAVTAANARTVQAEAAVNAQKGPYASPTEAYKAGMDAIKASGDSGAMAEVVPMHSGTFSVKISKPYAARNSDPLDRAMTKLQDAKDDLDMATETGNKKAIADAQEKYNRWQDYTTKISTRAPDRMAEMLGAVAQIANGGKPVTAPAAPTRPTTPIAAPVARPVAAPAPAPGPAAYRSADDVKAAVQAGTISRDAGVQILRAQFGYQ